MRHHHHYRRRWSQPTVPAQFVLVLPLLLCASVCLARNAPPELLPLDGLQSRIRIPLGTKSFKLTCPVRVHREHGDDGAGGGEQEQEQELIIKWSKDQQQLAVHSEQFRLANGDRDLRIRAPQLRDSGRYRCTAINEWGHRVVDFELEVFDPVTGKGPDKAGVDSANDGGTGPVLSESVSPPKWREPAAAAPRHIRVPVGAPLHLRCPPSTGNPLPQVIWLRGGAPVSLELTNALAASLSLDRVRAEDVGVYTCRVQNQLGSLQADFSVQLTGRDADSEGDEGGEGDLPALSAGTFAPPNPSGMALPVPPILRIDHPLQPQRNSNGSALVRVGNTAQLQCRVEWRREKSVIRWLRMVDSAEAVRARQPNATILQLGGMTLVVLEQGSDAVRVEMAKQRDEKVFVNELRIPNVQREDGGRYFCVVTNPSGQFVYRSALLQVVDAPPSPIWALLHSLPTSLPVRVALLAVFLLSLCCLPLLCCWLCRRSNSRGRLPPGKCAINTSSASNTFASSSSSSGGSSSSQQPKSGLLNNKETIPPPPPRMPPLPPSASFADPQMNVGGSTLFRPTPAFQWPMQTTTLDRRETAGHPMLHRTERADDEMSRLSSHIYASGSPLPPQAQFHGNRFYAPGTLLSQSPRIPPIPFHQSREQQQKAQLPPEPPRGNKRCSERTRAGGEEQRMPLIVAQRQSTELWQGN